ncbi:Transcription-repair-coupling factor, partial [Haemophilus influenzae]
INSKRTYCVSI